MVVSTPKTVKFPLPRKEYPSLFAFLFLQLLQFEFRMQVLLRFLYNISSGHWISDLQN